MNSNLNDLLKDAMSNFKLAADADCIVGTPIAAASAMVLPISKMSYGFVSGGYDRKQAVQKDALSEEPIGAVGGGVTVTPVGFLVVDGDDVYFIKTEGDNVNKWLDMVQSTVKKFQKQR